MFLIKRNADAQNRSAGLKFMDVVAFLDLGKGVFCHGFKLRFLFRYLKLQNNPLLSRGFLGISTRSGQPPPASELDLMLIAAYSRPIWTDGEAAFDPEYSFDLTTYPFFSRLSPPPRCHLKSFSFARSPLSYAQRQDFDPKEHFHKLS